jgi:EAL domain-containing protein (putative c-di-GMP-specific phosphodiesterase class I)
VPLYPGPSSSGIRYEILLRLWDPAGKLVSPAQFIPAAERFGLMSAIDRWVIQTAFRDFIDIFGQSTNACIAINLSGNSLTDDSLVDFVHQQFSDSGMPPERVCFEITETAVIAELHHAQRFIADVRSLGCQLALDDFGTGLSSLAYLKTLRVDYLKIDGNFVRNIVEDHVDRGMVIAINEMGHVMGVKTVGEYAHSAPVVEKLREIGVDYAQGFHFGVPGPLKREFLGGFSELRSSAL